MNHASLRSLVVPVFPAARRLRAFALQPVPSLMTAFNKSVSGGGYGPLLTSGQVLSGLGGKASIAITSLAEGFTCLAGASFFLLRGQTIHMELIVPVIAGALLSVPFSASIVQRVDESWLKRFIAYATIALGAITLVRSFR